jgi:hypothetical protein
MHSLADEHDTPVRTFLSPPGLGVVSVVQPVPFQFSANATWAPWLLMK